MCFVSKQLASTSFCRQVPSTLLVQQWRGSSGNVRLSNLLISSCLTFEPDPDHSLHTGTRFTPDFSAFQQVIWKSYRHIWSYGRIDYVFSWIRIIIRIQEPDLHQIFAFQQDIWRSYGQISNKFYALIAAGICTIWLGFKPDSDQSSDFGTGFTSDFWISAGYLKKLWMNLEEILCVDSRGDQDELIRFWPWSGS